jgi:phosphoglycerate dehydrogenase-like enzyme
VVSDEQLLEHLPTTEVYFGWHIPEERFHLCENLKWLHSASADPSDQLYDKFIESKIKLSISRATRASSMAEHVLGMMLYFARGFHICIRAQMRAHYAKGGAWDHFPFFRELNDSTLGIIGLGRIGKELAWRGKSLGMKVIATTQRDPSDRPEFVDELYGPEGLPLLLDDSDFLVCCIPETGDKEYIIGYEEFKQMKKTAYFFNVGRGSAVNEDELVEALMDKLIAGAGLDSFEHEPLPGESYLWRMEGTLITPGISGIGPHFWKRTHDLFLDNLRRYLSDEPLEDVVDKISWRIAIDEGLLKKHQQELEKETGEEFD